MGRILVFLFLVTFISFTNSTKPSYYSAGFSVPMIHKNSHLSPYHNPNASVLDLVKADRIRNEYLHSKTSFSAPLTYDALGLYLMVFHIGSLHAKRYVAMDTGSDLIWIQCYPCYRCDSKDRFPFIPTNSQTFRILSCNSLCAREDGLRCARGDTCVFGASYMDGSTAYGTLATETFFFPTTMRGDFHEISDIVFGCALGDNASTNIPAMDGVIGLGRRPLSLISQLSISRFSYCLPPPSTVSGYHPIRFGSEAKLQGGKTELVPVRHSSWYHIILKGVSVGPRRISIPNTTTFGGGNTNAMFIDSGTTLTYLHLDAYAQFAETLDEAVKLEKSTGLNLECCYYGTLEDVSGVQVTFHFFNLDVTVSRWGAFVEWEGLVCSTIQPGAKAEQLIFGMYAQINHNVGYDLDRMELSFEAMDCAT